MTITPRISAVTVLSMLRTAREQGLTAAEIDSATGAGHGSVSGRLSSMHRAGSIARLGRTKRPDGSVRHVYVLPEYVNGRTTETQGRKRAASALPRRTDDDPLTIGAIVRSQRNELAVRVLGKPQGRAGYLPWAGMDENYGQWFAWSGLTVDGPPLLLSDGITVLK